MEHGRTAVVYCLAHLREVLFYTTRFNQKHNLIFSVCSVRCGIAAAFHENAQARNEPEPLR
jgi:hypothetical protein